MQWIRLACCRRCRGTEAAVCGDSVRCQLTHQKAERYGALSIDLQCLGLDLEFDARRLVQRAG
jgi:hypothetical protein